MKITQLTEITEEVLTAFKTLIQQLSPGRETPSRKDLEEIISDKNSSLFVAITDNGEIAGTITLLINRIPSGQIAWIEDVVVSKYFRGNGIGEKLTLFVIDYVNKKGINEINLTSNPGRVTANKLYQKLGFAKRETNVYRLNL